MAILLECSEREDIAPWACFDIFNNDNANAARDAQVTGLNAANTQGQDYLSQGQNALNTSYAAGLAPIQANQASNTQGVDQLKKLLGIGPGGQGDIQSTLQNMPGYQFALNQGTQNVDRNQAAKGMLSSGNTDKAVADYTKGITDQNYNNYATQLSQFLPQQTATGGQIGSLDASLGNQLNANRTTAGNMAYGTQAGIGNANASADLAKNQASANMWSSIGGLAGGLAGFL